MPEAPIALILMAPVLTRGMITDAHLERLGRSCRIPIPEPLGGLDDAAHLERLDGLLPEVEIVLSGWGCPPLDATALARLPALRFVAHAAGTVKNHVSPDALARVRVSSAAAANAIPVAEYTLATILLANKRAFRLQRRYAGVRQLRMWSQEAPGIGNLGKVVGVVGASRVCRCLLQLLRPFDFDVLLFDPTLDEDGARALGAEPAALDELMRCSDVVTLHAPSLPTTRHMIGARQLASMKDGAVLINTARGGLVDHEALAHALEAGRIDAVIDTTEPEILPSDSPLYELDNVFLTPHIAGAMGTERWRLVDLALDEIERFVRGDVLEHEVRAEAWELIA